MADFEVSGASLAVACRPAPDVTSDTCEHLYLNQVLPLVWSEPGGVFHASAVEAGGGAAAFLAESGTGKSTLAASFATGGHRFLADDGLVVQPGGDGFLALAGHPSIRLWDDGPLVPPRDRAARAVHRRLALRGEGDRVLRAAPAVAARLLPGQEYGQRGYHPAHERIGRPWNG